MDFSEGFIKKIVQKSVDFGETKVKPFVNNKINNQIKRVEAVRDEVMEFSDVIMYASSMRKLFEKEGLEFSVFDVEDCKVDGNVTIVTLKDGSSYGFKNNELYDYKNGNAHIVFSSNEDIDKLKQLYDFDDDSKLDYTARIMIDSSNVTNFYSLGNGSTPTKQMAINFADQYKDYTPKALEYLKEGKFGGIICSSWDLASNTDLKNNAGAYVSRGENGQDYIYVPVGEKYNYNSEYYKEITVNHETGHVFDRVVADFDDTQKEELFEQYKDILPSLEDSAYGNASHSGIKQSPNSREFFADAISNYFTNGDELKRYIPELYDYINEVFQ